nr:hypothetical protein K-LCC10_0151 [Kaumoebavirus]
MEAAGNEQPSTNLPVLAPYSYHNISEEDKKKREAWLQAWKDMLPPK